MKDCRLVIIGLLILCFSMVGVGQNPFPVLDPVYKDDVVSRIDILMDPDSLTQLFASGNESSDHHFPATFIFDNGEVRDTVENIGFRLRGNTSRSSRKKSYKVSFNTYEKGRRWYDIEKLNLNGEHNDPSVIRSKLCWDLLRDFGVPAPRASHIDLYINNEYYGLYANIEHIDEEFVRTRFGNNNGNLYKCLWPADLVFLGNNPELYKYESGSRRAYDLKTNEEEDDYSDLAHFIDVLNNSNLSERPCELESVFNVNGFLRVMAFDILSGNWDGPLYNKNNFYLYKNEETGLFEYIPYDLDNTFGIDWFRIDWAERNIYSWPPSGEPRPLFWSIMEVEEYKDKFSFYVNEFITTIYSEESLFPKIDALQSLLRPSVESDPFYPLDYGYTVSDFDNSVDQPVSSSHTPIGIKTFISQRIEASVSQLELYNISPIISNVGNTYPNNRGLITIIAEVVDNGNPIVELCYQWNGSDEITCVRMYDDGEHDDENAGDNIYGVALNPDDNSGVFQYYIQTYDQVDAFNNYPKCGLLELVIDKAEAILAINEIMASNNSTVTDEAGEYDDWVEITNYGNEEIFLGGRFLSDKMDNPTKWALPDTWIQPGEYMLFWADEDQEQGDFHTNFKLSASGEFVGIFDTDENENKLIDGIEFGPQVTDQAFGRYPNGTGEFQDLDASPASANVSTTSTADNIDNQGIRVYPNPFNQAINIVTNFPRELDLMMYNQLGELVYKTQIKEHSTLQAHELQPGIYFITLLSENTLLKSHKLVKLN